MARLKWTPLAYQDLEAIGDYYAKDAPQFAQTIVNSILSQSKRLEVFPLSGRIVPEMDDPQFREIIYRDYRIVYFADDDNVEVLTVFHSSKNFGRPNPDT